MNKRLPETPNTEASWSVYYRRNRNRNLALYLILVAALVVGSFFLSAQNRRVNLDSWNRCEDRVSNIQHANDFYSSLSLVLLRNTQLDNTTLAQLETLLRAQVYALPDCGARP